MVHTRWNCVLICNHGPISLSKWILYKKTQCCSVFLPSVDLVNKSYWALYCFSAVRFPKWTLKIVFFNSQSQIQQSCSTMLTVFVFTLQVTLAVLLVYSIASLAVNAFLFLYKERHKVFAIYALVPSITAVYPLCMAAWVTKQYSW